MTYIRTPQPDSDAIKAKLDNPQQDAPPPRAPALPSEDDQRRANRANHSERVTHGGNRASGDRG